ncbi:MAG: hypothetical protein KAV82_05995 [Phycisphaerae bacterium]|nr:hypothetical protein [Phycisphaerae bacterium]
MQASKANFQAWGGALLVAALLAAVASSAEAYTWLAVTPDARLGLSGDGAPQAARVDVNRHNDTGLEVSVDILGLELASKTTQAGEFVEVRWPEAPIAGEIGRPALPVVRKLFIAPQGATVDLVVHEGQPSVINLQEVGFAAPVMPVQARTTNLTGIAKQGQFDYDSAAYAVDELLPTERVSITEAGVLRGKQLYLLEVRPVAYNPARGTLTVWPDIEVSIRFQGGRFDGRGMGPMAPLNRVLLNPQRSKPIGRNRGEGNYLILIPEDFHESAPITQFANAKTAQGFDVTTHTVAVGTNISTIKTYIEGLWGTADAPDYLLIVGIAAAGVCNATSNLIPVWLGGGDKQGYTDLPYACMDAGDDWYPDMAYGRWPVETVAELQNVVDKTLYVEDGNFVDPSFAERAVFIATSDTDSGAEPRHDWIIDTYMTPNDIQSSKLYALTYGADTADITDAFNAGAFMCVYFGHSGYQYWTEPYFGLDEVDALSNDGLYPFVVSFSCVIGNFYWTQYTPSLHMKMLSAPNKGAVAAYGPAVALLPYSWDDWGNLYKFLFQALYADGIRELSPAIQTAMGHFLTFYGASDPVCRDFYEVFNLQGDPSLSLVNPPPDNYLIVAPEDFASCTALTDFAGAKTAQGFNVSIYNVPSGTSNTTIKTYIESLWGTADAPDYILIVGDTDGATSTSSTIPHFQGAASKHADTDLPYACMDGSGDWYPDIAIGRFSVQTEASLKDVVTKSLFVEAGNFSDPDYVKRGAFLANPSTYGTAEPVHDWVIDNYFTPNNYEGIKLYSAQGAGTQDVIDAVNNGCLFTLYFGHSSSSGWWDPSFDGDDVLSLSNLGLYGLVFGWSCNTSHFSYDECLGETWLRAPNRGAAAYISASDYIYWGSAAAWEPSVVLEKSFFAAFFEDDIWEVGPAWQAGLYRFLTEFGNWDGNPEHAPQQNGDIIRNFFEEFVLLGDPALRLPQPDGFTLTPAPTSLDTCCPPDSQAQYTIEVGQTGDFAESVTLTASDTPVGATVEFSQNSQVPPFTSVLTVGNLGAVATGEYNILITGTTTSLLRVANVELSVSTAVPSGVTLTSPANGSDDISKTPTLVWEPSSQALGYDIQIATDAGFGNVVYEVTVTGTNHTVGISLNSASLYYWHVRADNGCGDSGFSAPFSFTTLEQADYFTEEFLNDFDLGNSTVAFIPDGSGDYYEVCGSSSITAFGTDPANPTGSFNLVEDGYGEVMLSGETRVHLYGVSYDKFYVGDNGYITFTSGDTAYNESLTHHFQMPRISALFDDLSAPHGGTITWKQVADRIAVTWDGVPEYTSTGSNTFQIEMFFDGRIHITWLQVSSNDSIVGLSPGGGVPEDPFPETNISSAPPCTQESSFTLDADPQAQDICVPGDAVYTIDVEQILGFSEAVTLNANGEPTGATVDFSVNSVAPPFTSLMTVGNLAGASPGDYNIAVVGTATGGMVRSTIVRLGVSTTVPGQVMLSDPPTGDTGVSLSPALSWHAPSQALGYDLHVATDANFDNVVYSVKETGTVHVLGIELKPRTLYYWHVQANNGCGSGEFSDPFSFRTVNMILPASYDMLNGEGGTYTYYDDAYDGKGDNTVALEPLSGGLGDLTDGVIATEHWGVTSGPYVGWQSIDPTITFHFAETATIEEVILHLDDSGGGGGVVPPDDVTITVGEDTLVFPVTDPPGDEPFAFTCADLGMTGDTLELTIADYSAGAYMMLSEVQFKIAPYSGACCVGETCTVVTEDECLAQGGEYCGDQTECNPNPCAFHESACLIISEIVYGVESGGCPRWIEITNPGLTDFSFIEGGIIVQMDDGSDVVVDADLSGVTIAAGESYVLNSNHHGVCTGAFRAIYGFDPDSSTEADFGDGNDRYILTDTDDGSNLLDIYGEFGVNGTGQAWEYTNGFSYCLPAYNSGNRGDFVAGEWFFGGVGSLTGDNPIQILLDNTSPGTHTYDQDCMVLPGDLDRDGDVDLRDFAEFQSCFDQSAIGECQPANMAGGLRVDLDDLALFIAALGGPQ